MTARTPGTLHEPADLFSEALAHPGHSGVNDADFFVEGGGADEEVEAPAAERVADLPGAVRREHYVRRMLGANRAELGDGHLKVGQDLEEKRLEPVVRAVHLIHQQYRRSLAPRDGPQQGSLEQVVSAEDDLLELGGISSVPLRHAQSQELALVVPFVQRRVDVQPLIALESDQLAAKHLREHPGDLGLPNSRVAFDHERLAHLPGQEQGGGDRGLGDVPMALQRFLHRADLGSHAGPPALRASA